MKYLSPHLSAGLLALLLTTGCMKSPVIEFQPSTPGMGMGTDASRFAAPAQTPRFYWVQDINVKVSGKELLTYEHLGDLTVQHEVQLDVPELIDLARKYQADLVIAELAFEEMGEDIGMKLSSATVPRESGSASDNAVRSWVTSQGVDGAPTYESKQEYSVEKKASHVYRLKLYRKLKD
jgi:hypothetical protein